MLLECFSIVELEKRLAAVETVEEKIKLIAYEILRCKRAIHEIEHQVNSIDPASVKFTAKINCSDPSILDILNSDRELRHHATKQILFICRERICEKYNDFLKEAQELYDYYQTEFDIKVRGNDNYQKVNEGKIKPNSKRIVWLIGKDKLLKILNVLKERNILSGHGEEEMLSHFADEKHIPFSRGMKVQRMLRWCKSDSSFSIFVDELAKRNAINDEYKYKIFEKHFLNRNGKPFRYLAQKKNHTLSFTKTGNIIKEILDSIKISIVIFFSIYYLGIITMIEGFVESISEYIVM